MRIETYRAEHAAAFDALNRAWLVDNGLLEPADEPHLTDPVGSIIDQGGQIFVATDGGVVIGTSAIVPHGDLEFELNKLAVARETQGRGIGRKLVDCAVDFARAQGARRVTLLSNSRLRTAVRLYERMGFRHAPLPPTNPYATADVYMILDLDPGSESSGSE